MAVMENNDSEKKVAIAVTIGLVVLILAVGLFFYTRYQNSQSVLNISDSLTPEQSAELVAKIGKIITLPPGEIPTIATVTDKTTLQNQEFFVLAENGDKVLIYSQAGKAYLYRPSQNKIINMAPVIINSTPAPTGSSIPSGSPHPTPSEKPTATGLSSPTPIATPITTP